MSQSTLVTALLSYFTSSQSARLMPWMTLPSMVCCSPIGLMIWPQSCATVNLPRPDLAGRTIDVDLERDRDQRAVAARIGEPRPVTVLPLWSLRGEGRGFQSAFCAAALITAMSRAFFRWRSRSSTGSTFSAAATSSMNDSLAKWICGPTGSRRCEVRSGEARSRNGGMVSHEVFLLANT